MSNSMQRLLSHLAGDYLAQSHWMATKKTSQNLPAAAHALSYTACFLPLTRNPKTLAIIGGTHFILDRWRLAKHITWAKNQIGPKKDRPGHTATGYSEETPAWLATMLLIVADNTIHLAINEWALNRDSK